MNKSPCVFHAASVVAQLEKDRVPGLGRGPGSKNNLQSPNTLKILQLNINGISTNAARIKLEQTLELADAHGVQIIALQETKLKLNTSLTIKGYSIFRNDRLNKSGGGLLFLIRGIYYQSINIRNSIIDNSNLEIQGIRLTWRGKPLNILNMYHPPDLKSLPNDLQELFSAGTICIGDLNAKHPVWGSSSVNSRGNDLINMIDDKGFMILNDGTPTHNSYSYNSGEALDISFVSPELAPSCKWKVLETVGSDHLPILTELNRRQSVYSNKEKRWNFKRADWQSFTSFIEDEVEKNPPTDKLDTNWLTLKKIIIRAANRNIPRGKVKTKKPYLFSKSPSLQPLLEERRNLVEELKVDNSNVTRIKLNKINAELKRMYAQIKRDKWNELCGSLDSRSPNGKLWKLVKNLSKEQPQVEKCNIIQDKDGNKAQNDCEAANIFGTHYQNVSRLNFNSNDRGVKFKASNIVHGCRSSPQDGIPPIFNRDFIISELEAAILDTNMNKSPGPDGIHGQMINNLGQRGRHRLLNVINDSWRMGRLPRDWRRAIIIPIKNPSKEANSPESFRPIALTCIACKVMEKMILKRLTFYLNSDNLLSKEQYGFREGHSTTDQVLYFCQRIRDAHNMKPTNHTVAAFLDLSKAFDTVWCQKLIIKLFDVFGIGGRALTWIYDFLRNRLIKVRFNNSFSDSFRLYQGVPQGSVLSPTLFSLFLTGIEHVIPKSCEIGLFADDIVIWSSGIDLRKLENDINLALDELWKFAEVHKLNFNPTKSTVGFFTTNRKLYNFHPNIFLNHQPLNFDKHPKYLGFVLDPEILSNKHIDNLVLRARRRLNILKYISGRNWGADATTLRNTYISLIRPILEYGFPIYCCASESNLQRLERVQLSAARIITGLRNSCPNEIVLYEADLQPLRLRRSACLVKYYNKLCSLGSRNRTSALLGAWSNNQRLKRNSPFSHVLTSHIASGAVEPQHLTQCIDPSEGLPGVFFHKDLPVRVNKQTDLPIYLRQLTLERISHIPGDAVQMYTDGSKNDQGCSGSGIYIKFQDQEIKIQKRNPDYCSVFRSELIAINEGLELLQSLTHHNDIWILSDSRSSIQHLANWHSVRDTVGANILKHLKLLSLSHQIHLQWIPSHIGIEGNETADTLAKAGADDASVPIAPLTYMEIFARAKSQNKSTWQAPPIHHWYKSSRPGGSLTLACGRRDQTALTRFLSGHLRTMIYSEGSKQFEVCTKCHTEQASPEHILTCIGLSRQDLFDNPLLVLDFFRVHNFIDLI